MPPAPPAAAAAVLVVIPVLPVHLANRLSGDPAGAATTEGTT